MNQSLEVAATASDEKEAQIIAAVLESAGIPTFIEGSSLTEAWAVSQRIMGQISVEVKVAAEHLERAREILEEARAAGRELAKEEELDKRNDAPRESDR